MLLPGDPQRSRKMAALFAEASFTAHRGTFATYTGKTPGGADIAVTSSGMGCACVAAALEELAAAGAEAVIRVGTCGGVQPDLALGTIVIASGCVRGEGASYELVPPEFPAVADPLLVRALCSAAQELDEPVGRKLDFLTQELNRETNTIGSKCQDLDITRIVVDMKAEIEKIREQIQNIE